MTLIKLSYEISKWLKISYNNFSRRTLMQKNLSIQTVAAFERIYEAIVGKTSEVDDLSLIILHLRELLQKANEVDELRAELNN